jgi:hypothetical protein
MPLNRDTFQKLIDLFTSHFETLDQRRTLLGGAFFSTDVLAKVQLEGAPDEFTTRTLHMLIQHGEIEPGTPAIIRLLQQLRGTVGVDKQAEIDALVDTIRYELVANPSKPAGKPRIFISYSRADGENFATDLRKRLEAENLALWQDRDRMEGGVGWWKQITDALDAVEFMVLVATPAAIASAVVKKEWRYARQQGVCVYPVQVPGLPLDFPAMPKWMRDSHFYNLDHEWATFVNYLKAPCTVPKVPFMAPDLPEHFVQRPEKFAPLKQQLLDADFDNPVAITTALKGAGGFGKTTLAAALCHDEDVQTAFDEGVLWVTLGEEPNIINKLNVLYRALTDENPSFIEIEEGANKLAEKLVDADVLMVIDDVWNPAHLRPFLRGGERVARLVTTRFSNIAVDANADLLEVDEMTSDESVQMLLAGIAPPDDLTPFRQLAERLGEWALMLEVTNGTLRKRMSKGADLNGALAYVNKALDKRGVGGLKTGSNEAAVQVLDTSIAQVDEDDQPRLFELSIFVEDTNIPLTSVMALWDMDDFDTEELIDQFDDLSFVRFDAEHGTIRLHDVVREVLAARLDDPAAVHARLVDDYGDLTQLPDDYAWNNIAYHLLHSEQPDRLRTLLLNAAFLYNKFDATDVRALIEDCNTSLQTGIDSNIRLLRSALNMSAHILAGDKKAMAHQLIGRLMSHYQNSELTALLDGLSEYSFTFVQSNPFSEYATHIQGGGPLLATLTGHTSWVNGALELSDGNILSWAGSLRSEDPTLRLWQADGTLLNTFEGHTGLVRGALELSDSNILSWAGKELRLWQADGTPLNILTGHTGLVWSALELSDGNILSWAGKELRIWRADGKPIKILEGHIDYVVGALELSDGNILSWAGKELRIWRADGTPTNILSEHTEVVKGAMALHDGNVLSWSEDNTLRLWQADGTAINTFKGHARSVNSALQLHNNNILSWSEDNTLRLWQPDGVPLNTLEGHTGSVQGALELHDGNILSWSNDSTLRLWDPESFPNTANKAHNGGVRGMLELSDGNILSWGGSFRLKDTNLRLWKPDGTLITTLEGHTGSVRGALELNDGNILSWAGEELWLWHLDGELVKTLEGHTYVVSGVRQMTDGNILSWWGSFRLKGNYSGRVSQGSCDDLSEHLWTFMAQITI